jgi:hypothetical protein
MRWAGLLAFACAVLPTLPALANARVVPSGTVALSHGQGFQEISTPVDGQPGRFRDRGAEQLGQDRLL